MSDPTATSGSARKRLRPSMFLGLLVWPVVILAAGGVPTCMGFEDPALRVIEQCPAAVEVLGAPVTRAWLGCSCGNAETSDSFGQASWTFPIAGPRGSGSVDVVAERRGGPWRILSATVEAGGRTIDAVSCTASGPVAVPTTTFAASVASTIGTPPVREGDACQVSIEPGDGPYPCHVRIVCGATTLYGGGSLGYAQCRADAQGALAVQDTDTSASGGDPTLDLRLGEGEAVLTDAVAAGTWVVTLRFEPRSR